MVFPKDTDDDVVNDAREQYHQYGGANVRQTQEQTQGRANSAMCGAGHETGGLMMEFNQEQALINCLHLRLLQKDPFSRTALGGRNHRADHTGLSHRTELE